MSLSKILRDRKPQAPHFWAGVGGAVVIRWCAHPAAHLRPGDVEKVLVFLNAMSVGILTFAGFLKGDPGGWKNLKWEGIQGWLQEAALAERKLASEL